MIHLTEMEPQLRKAVKSDSDPDWGMYPEMDAVPTGSVLTAFFICSR